MRHRRSSTHIPGTVFTAGDNAYVYGTLRRIRTTVTTYLGSSSRPNPPCPRQPRVPHAWCRRLQGAISAVIAMPRGNNLVRLRPRRLAHLRARLRVSRVGWLRFDLRAGSWLTADLARHPRRCVAAIWHVPLFSSGSHGSDPRMSWAWRTLDVAGAELVISGHEHDYERFSRQHSDGSASSNGMREFIVGPAAPSCDHSVARAQQPRPLEREPRRPGPDPPPGRATAGGSSLSPVPPSADSGTTACS